MPQITIAPLTAEAFAPYGDVFPVPAAIQGRTDQVAKLHNGRAAAKANLFVVRSNLATLPHRFDRMESHPFSSQSFTPLEPARIVLAVARPGPDGQPDVTTLRAFEARSVGFSYHAGIWHLPLAALGAPAPVLGFMYEDGSPQDCVWAEVEPSALTEG